MRVGGRGALWVSATLLLMGATSAGTWLFWSQRQAGIASQIPASMLKSTQFTQFVDTYRLIRHDAVWGNSPKQLLSGATNGMVGTLHDQFSNYLSPQALQGFTQLLSPRYAGIGVAVGPSMPLTVQQVFSGSPAAKAHIVPGDIITAINGKSLAKQSVAQALSQIRGPVGGTVRLAIKHGTSVRSVRIVRQMVSVPTVYSHMIAPHVGYMAITEFGNNTGQEAVAQFHQLVRQGAQGILLDLRNNPGGEVSQALTVSNLFVPKGPVVTLKYKNKAQDHTYDSQGPGTRLPVVVMVNGNTASAAEILSAAIQERQGGLLVGTQTYGKGIVQEVLPLPGHAALKLTVAKYYTPDHQYIEHVGLKPNVIVTEQPGVVPSDNPHKDPQLAKGLSILLKRVRGTHRST